MKKIRYWTLRIALGLIIWSIAQVITLRFIPVYITPLMAIRTIQQISRGEQIRLEHTWIDDSKINKSLKKAVVASEDNLFYKHHGFDINQIQIAIQEANKGKRNRGASTISQQTAKNVFLWNGGGLFRKTLEAYYTILIELCWGKKRIMEVYLNSIEMGDGIYGAQAVAKHHFNTQAKHLTTQQAALIAASLPNPLRFNSAKPSTYMIKRQRNIISLMNKIDFPKEETKQKANKKSTHQPHD